MKKISLFLATVMFFLAVATIPGSLQEVQAFPYSDSKWDSTEEVIMYDSAKAGAKMHFSCSLDDRFLSHMNTME